MARIRFTKQIPINRFCENLPAIRENRLECPPRPFCDSIGISPGFGDVSSDSPGRNLHRCQNRASIWPVRPRMQSAPHSPNLAAAACPCALPRTVSPRVSGSAVAPPAPKTTGILMKFVDAGLPGVRRHSCSAITEACPAARRHRRLPADVRNDVATMCARPIAASRRTAGQSSCLWRFLFLCLLPW